MSRHQWQIIEALMATGDVEIAERIARCDLDRQHRRPGWPARCRNGGCWNCRRPMMRAWWQAFRHWLDGATVSLAIVPIGADDLITAVSKLRRGLRDVRDRAGRDRGREHPQWRQMAFAGLGTSTAVLVLIRHDGIDREELYDRLSRRWPMVVVTDADRVEPDCQLTVTDAAALARKKRSLEPVRIVILPQMAVDGSAAIGDDQAMPWC